MPQFWTCGHLGHISAAAHKTPGCKKKRRIAEIQLVYNTRVEVRFKPHIWFAHRPVNFGVCGWPFLSPSQDDDSSYISGASQARKLDVSWAMPSSRLIHGWLKTVLILETAVSKVTHLSFLLCISWKTLGGMIGWPTLSEATMSMVHTPKTVLQRRPDDIFSFQRNMYHTSVLFPCLRFRLVSWGGDWVPKSLSRPILTPIRRSKFLHQYTQPTQLISWVTHAQYHLLLIPVSAPGLEQAPASMIAAPCWKLEPSSGCVVPTQVWRISLLMSIFVPTMSIEWVYYVYYMFVALMASIFSSCEMLWGNVYLFLFIGRTRDVWEKWIFFDERNRQCLASSWYRRPILGWRRSQWTHCSWGASCLTISLLFDVFNILES